MIGFFTLFKREMVRYLKSPLDTIAPPIISVVLFIFIFGLALGGRLGEVSGVPYIQFMLPGLIMMSVILNSFLNPAFSTFQSRWHGNIADFLASPLSKTQMAAAIILAGVLRGLIVGTIVLLAALLFTGLPFVHPVLLAVYALFASLSFASFGCIIGLWTRDWDGVNAIEIFLLDPLVMLGGVFYSLEMVRSVPILSTVVLVNPFTHITGGFRYAVLGVTDTNPWIGLAITAGLALALLAAAVHLFRRGYHLTQ